MISIHTPTRGVTCEVFPKIILTSISIHTPTRGVTPVCPGITPAVRHFNPHAHEGRDGVAVTPRTLASDFNPHAHEGRDL